MTFCSGDWTEQNSGSRYWGSIASSADGSKLAAVDQYGSNYQGGQIYTSTDSGVTWTAQNSGSRPWGSIASSADGSKLAAVDSYNGRVYTSIDSGVTWKGQNSGRRDWGSITSSADGSKLAAVSMGDQIYTSVFTPAGSSSTPLEITSPTSASITAVSATLGGDVTSDGGASVTERGVVYALTATNSNPQIGGTGVTKAAGTGTTGVFTVAVSGLSASTGYSYAAYATNAAGTSYTSVGTFTTTTSFVPGTGVTVTYSGVIGGTAPLSITSGGTLELTGPNTYTADTNVQNGTVSVSTVGTGTNAQSLGQGSAVNLGVAGTSSGSLVYTGGAGTLDKTINALGNGSDTVQNAGTGLLTLSGTLNKTGTVLKLQGGASGITVSGSITGNTGSPDSDLIIDGGIITLASANTYSGPTYIINGGTLNAAAVDALPTSPARSAILMDQSGTGSSTLALGVSQAVLSLTGASTSGISLNANTLTIGDSAGSTTFAGIIGGTGGLTKDGASTLVLSGANTYSGGTTINAGTVALGTQADQALGTGTVVVTSGGTLQTNRNTLTNSLTLNGGILQEDNGFGSTFSGAIDLATTSTVTTPYSMSFSNTLSGAGGLIKNGTGTVTLSGTNTYTGATTVSAGVLNIQNANALGSIAGSTAVASGAALQIQGGITTAAEALTLNGTGVSTDGALRNISGTNTYAGLVTLGAASRINSDAGTLTLSNAGTVTGAGLGLTVGGAGNTTIASIIGTTTGTLIKDGAGTLTLTGVNTYTGATTVSAGTLQIGNGNGSTGSGSISSSSAVSTAAGATLSISLRNNTSFNNNIANTGNVTFLSGGTTSGTGITNSYGGVISGTGSVTKEGIGIAIVNATQTYTGTTTINFGRLQIGTNSTTGALSPSSAITNNGTLQFFRSNTVTQGTDFASVISGTGVVQQAGSGTLVLNGANTYTGATTVSFGTLQIGDGGTTGSLSTSSALTNNATLTFNRSNTVTQGTDFNSVISGTGAVTQAGSGTLVLNGANTYGGATTVSTGVLNIRSAAALGGATAGTSVTTGAALQIQGGITTAAEALTLNGTGVSTDGALRNISGDNTYAGLVTLGAASRINSDAGTLTLSNAGTITGATFGLTVGGAGNTTIASIIGTTTGPLTKDGAGTLTLSGANTYSGGTTINAGSVSLGVQADQALGTGTVVVNSGGTLITNRNALTNSFTLNGGTLQEVNGFGSTFSGAIDLAATSTVTGESGRNMNFSNIVSGAGSLIKNGGNRVTLSGANTYTGATTVSAGTLTLSNVAGYKTTALSAASGATLSILMPGNATSAVAAGSDPTAIAFNSVNAAIAGAGVVTLGTTAGAHVYAGSSAGAMTTNLSAGGVLDVQSGQWQWGYARGSAATNNGSLNLASGTAYRSSDTAFQFDALTGSGTIGNSFSLGAVTLTLGVQGTTNNATYGVSSNTATFSGVIASGESYNGVTTSALNLVKSGSGTQVLSGSNTYTGTTTISAGTLQIGDGGTTGALSTSSSITNNATLSFNRSNTITQGTDFNSVISGTGALTKAGSGMLVLNGANTFTGATTISAGTLNLSGAGNANNSNIAISGSSNLTFTATDSRSFTKAITGTAGNISFNVAGNTDDGGGGDGTSFSMSNTGAFTGTVVVNTGLINAPGNAAFGDAANVIQLNAASGQSAGIVGNGLTLPSTRSIQLTQAGGNSVFRVWSFSTFQVDGQISGAGNLVKTDGGTAILAGANTFTGTTRVGSGTLQINNALALQNSTLDTSGSGVVTLSSVTTPTLGGLIGSTNLASRITTGYSGVTSLTLNPGTGAANTYSGVVADGAAGMALVKTGAGTQTLSGANTYTGATTVSEGTLQIGNGSTTGALSTSSSITNNGTLAFNRSNTITQGTDFNSVISGTGAVTQAGSGTLVLNGVNTYSGGTTINAGTVALGRLANQPLGTGAVVVNSGSTLITDRNTLTNSLTLNGGTLQENNGFGSTFSGAIDLAATSTMTTQYSMGLLNTLSGAGGLVKNGTGTVALSGANTFTGTTTISAGTLQIGAGGTTGSLSTSSAITNNGTLSFNRSNTITQGTDFNSVISGTGAVTKAGSGTLEFTGANTYTGATTVSAGILNLRNATGLGTAAGGTTVSDGATLQLQGGITVGAEELSLNGGAASGQTGALVNISGTNTYGGAVTVTASSSISAASGSVLNLTGGVVKNGTVATFNGGGTINVNTVAISGSSANSDLVIDGTTVNVDVASTYNGPTFIRNSGTLNANVLNALPTANGRTAVTFDGTGTSVLTLGAAQSVASLTSTGAATVTLNANTLTVGTSTGSTTFAGIIGGTGGLIKDGASTLVLSGTNTYTGATTVSAGTLSVTGSIGSSSLTTINGGTLSGTGTVGAVQLNSAGTVNVGAGTLSTGNFAITDGQLVFSIGGTGSYGQLNTSGTINLTNGGSGAQLVINAINGYTAQLGDSFTLISNDLTDSISGYFAGLTEGQKIPNFLGSALTGQITYVGGTGNDVVMRVISPGPTVTSLTPSTGSTGGGTSVTITGTDFTGTTGVTIGGAAATSVTVVNSTTITAVTPAGTAGTASVVVTTSGGSNAANTLYTFVNTAPTDIALSATTIAENNAANATVGTLSTTDVDAGDTFTYTLVSGTGSTDNSSFTISGDALKLTPSADYETKSSYAVRVRTTDAGGLFYEEAFTISITNVNETPTDIALSAATIAENNAANATVGTLSTTDVDAGDTFTYTLVSGTGSTDNSSFTISGDALKLTPSADYETKSSYAVRVRTTDAGGLFYEEAFTISITNVIEVPTVTAISPAKGSTAGGMSVTITGTELFAGSTVTIGGAAATSVTVVNSTTITAITPAGSAGPASVIVTTSDGSNAANTLYTYVVPVLRDIEETWVSAYSGPSAPTTLRNGEVKAVTIQRGAGGVAAAVFATGFTTNAAGNKDIYTTKHDPATGAVLWSVTFNGTANRADEAVALAVDGNGDVIITGTTTNAANNTDVYTAKYAGSNGDLLWSKTYAGSGNLQDAGVAVAVDASGNVAVAGYGYLAASSYDFFAARYSADGTTVYFERLIDVGNNRADAANGLAVDATTGDLALVGYARNAANNMDFRVLKLAAADGATQWQWNVNGTGNGDDQAYAVAIDGSGNVVATGTVRGTSWDLYTVKLNNAGALVWQQLWNSSYSSSDAGYDVAVDSTGDVVVAGVSYQAGAADGYVVKYSSSSGSLIWDRRLNGSAGFNDLMRSVDLDREDNVVATGYSQNAAGNQDVITAKMLAGDGGLVWEKLYNGTANKNDNAASVAVSSDGNVFVGGYATTASNTTDYLVLGYHAVAPAVQTAQSITFANPGTQSAGTALNLVATASSGLTVRFTVISGPAAVDVTNNARLIFSGTGTVVVRASQSGSGSFAAAADVYQSFTVNASSQTISFSLPASTSYANTVALSALASSGLPVTYGIVSGPGTISGNVLSFTGSGDVTVRANQAGNGQFSAAAEVQSTINAVNTPPVIIPNDIELGSQQTYAGSGAGEGRAVALQTVGNSAIAAFIAGYTTNAAGNKDIYLAKVDSNGSPAWAAPVIVNGAGSSADEAVAVAVDDSGHVYISGFVTVSTGNTDVYVAKFNGANGSNLWTKTFAGTANGADAATALVLQGTSHVIIGGYATNTGTGTDFFAAKLNQSDGNGGWSSSINSAAALADSAVKVAVGADGNVALAGTSGKDAWTVQLAASNGALNWQRRYDAAAKFDGARSVAIDANNDVIITAYAQAATYDIYTAKYSRVDGSIVWSQTFNSSFNSSDAPWALTLDGSGNVYVVGTSYRGSGSPDSITLKYEASAGSLLWQQRYNGPAGKADEHYAISVDANGSPVVSGYSVNADNSTDIYTAKLAASSGLPIWETRFNGAANKSDLAQSVAADPGGRAWVAGYLTNSSSSKEILLLKYQPVGSTPPPPPPPPAPAPESLFAEALFAPPPPPEAAETAAIYLQVEQGDSAAFAASYHDADGNSTVSFSAEIDGVPSGSVSADSASGLFQWQQDTSRLSAGEHEVIITAADSAGASSSLAISSNSPARAWRFANFGSTALSGKSADDADPDHDGLSNLTEFAFGLDPSQAEGAAAAQGSIAPDSSGLKAIFHRRKDHQAAGITYQVEFSHDLSTWTPSAADPEILSDEGVTEQVAVPFPALPPGKSSTFFRITVEPQVP